MDTVGTKDEIGVCTIDYIEVLNLMIRYEKILVLRKHTQKV